MYYKITCEHFGCLICFRYFPREALKFNHLFPHQFGLFSTRIKKKKNPGNQAIKAADSKLTPYVDVSFHKQSKCYAFGKVLGCTGGVICTETSLGESKHLLLSSQTIKMYSKVETKIALSCAYHELQKQFIFLVKYPYQISLLHMDISVTSQCSPPVTNGHQHCSEPAEMKNGNKPSCWQEAPCYFLSTMSHVSTEMFHFLTTDNFKMLIMNCKPCSKCSECPDPNITTIQCSLKRKYTSKCLVLGV